MPLTLSLAMEGDMPDIVRAQYAAFHPNDTMHVLIYPAPHPVTEEVIQKTVERQIKYWHADSHITWLKVTDDETGEIVAAAKWIVWPPSEVEGGEKRWPDKVNVNWVEEGKIGMSGNAGKGADDKEYVSYVMEEFFGRRRQRALGPGVLLDICFTDPRHHRRGAGKMLVGWGAEKADEFGVKGFVEASYTGRKLYESMGFVVTEDVLLRGGSVRQEWEGYGEVGYLWMERDARV